MVNFNKKLVGTLAAFAVLASGIPSMASAVTIHQPVVKAEKAKAASDRILVKTKTGLVASDVAARHGLTEKKTLGNSNWKVLNVPAGQAEAFVAKLQNDADVEAVELDHVRTISATPNDPSYGSQYHLTKIQANTAWDITKGSTSRTIAIIDTGVDLNHADLKGKIVAGTDIVNGDSVAQDDHGHGTHCAGLAAAITNNATNVAGVDWNAKIMPIKVLDSTGSGFDSDIDTAVYWAADHGANVISMSLGGAVFSQATQDAINYAYNKGLIIVAAAGNESTSAMSYPAAYNNVLSVASTTSTDAKSSFSNYGSWVDVAAPGSSILSLKLGGGTTTMSGTSMATPIVAGLASLTWSKNLTYTNTAVINRINTTADKITGTGTYWINGRVNAYKAVNGF
ncbi:S8 family serine peptidase [Tumebacillus permanentifrigoris]|uniref:Thermitase n=1 Tax=Tumebacillus permanentifrigoris TaxID=378543 RepID=A0A316D8X5_9BACL|nr:S8 family serine peptidase [Tumebacillus permanentifrigoris]PWK13436.1 thermitase [Tumebacillus permanentifrigoris]